MAIKNDPFLSLQGMSIASRFCAGPLYKRARWIKVKRPNEDQIVPRRTERRPQGMVAQYEVKPLLELRSALCLCKVA